MTLAESNAAIGAVTRLILEKLNDVTSLDVILGFPREDPGNNLYLLLYEVVFDPSLKNVTLEQGLAPPIWLVLKYLLTAYDGRGDYEAYHDLGMVIRTLQNLNYLDPTTILETEISNPLRNNPEPLKVTFDEAPLDLLSKILGSVDEKYQCSICFQVRPIMISLEAPPSFSLLVGVDYTPPGGIREDKGLSISTEHLRIPHISKIQPKSLEFEEDNKTVLIIGSNLDLSNPVIRLGSDEFYEAPNPISGRLEWSIGYGDVNHAGTYPLSIAHVENPNTPEAKVKSVSNVEILHIAPLLTGDPNPAVATLSDVVDTTTNIRLTGTMLGRTDDSVLVAFYITNVERTNRIVTIFDDFEDGDFSPDQKSIVIRLDTSTGLSAGNYRVILRVNSQQARWSPQIQFKPYLADAQLVAESPVDPEITKLELTGTLLGGIDDDITITLEEDGHSYECSEFARDSFGEEQKSLISRLSCFDAILPGTYSVRLTVNGVSAVDEKEVILA